MTSDQRERIAAFYQEMYDRLFLYARNTLEHPPLAEEAIQETFRVVCMKPEELLNSPNPQGWIINTLKFTMRSIRRDQEKTAALLNQYLETYTDSVTYTEDQVPLELTYGPLAHSEEFQLLREMAVEGKSHLEMAQSRGISVAACKKRVQRAKKFLQRKI